MPELPEVETIKRDLNRHLKGLYIENTYIYVDKVLRNMSISKFKKIKNEEIVKFHRKGKSLVMETTNYYFAFHLRLEGKILIEEKKDKYTLCSFKLNNDKYLIFDDFRKFATLDIYSKEEYKLKEINEWTKLGPEPWDINVDQLYEQIHKKIVPIKTTLLDQKYMSGLGNIYVDESLFKCKVSPIRKTKDITKKELTCLVKAANDIMKDSIKHRGSSIRTYGSLGKPGSYQSKLKVHTREGDKCPDGKKIIKIQVGGRGTYYCKGYQK